MGTQVFTSQGTLWLELCCTCKTPFAISDQLHTVMLQRAENGSFYCPNGHAQCYASGETELDKMRRERDRLAQQIAYKDDVIRDVRNDRDSAQRRLWAARGQITKIKKRVGNGVCPCCSRTFTNLARHMASQHSEYVQHEEVA